VAATAVELLKGAGETDAPLVLLSQRDRTNGMELLPITGERMLPVAQTTKWGN